MKSIGIVRTIDALGRIVLPVELRKKFNIGIKDSIEIYTQDDCIILRKYEPSCIFCGNSEDIIEFNEKCVCKDCAEKLTEMAGKSE